eukprot:TRINITY_DN28270_c0_g2_i2.p1 TRINITY_DN28270_c0_g2~~TRINITY_DN28270_c0_g2_i2.p1  ORF type:complete len:1120 (-),score=319.90 TRINITY_DN28270_c0_g2_i2:60-3419(-)
MIRRPPRSTLSSSSAASDVYKRQYQRRVRGTQNRNMDGSHRSSDEHVESDNITVAVRIRPGRDGAHVAGLTSKDTDASKSQLTLEPCLKYPREWQGTFDSTFAPEASQADVYQQCVQPLVQGWFEGYNATVLAYGQTGSGKTFTMGTGGNWEHNGGIIPLAISDTFDRIEQDRSKADFVLRASFVEIHNEKIRDLLDSNVKEVKVVEDVSSGQLLLQGAREVGVNDAASLHRCLERGMAERTTASTAMNSTSSRSHAILTITMEQRQFETDEFKVSKFHCVDLAGSERLERSGATGAAKGEAITINSGLLVIGKVILALVEGKPHVPYRDSKLTRILQDSLGGNSRTAMIACVSGEPQNRAETRSTLEYACRARNIRNKPKINHDPNEGLLARIKRENIELMKEMAELKDKQVNPAMASEFSSMPRAERDAALQSAQEATVRMHDLESSLAELRQANDTSRLHNAQLEQKIKDYAEAVFSAAPGNVDAGTDVRMAEPEETTMQAAAFEMPAVSQEEQPMCVQLYQELNELRAVWRRLGLSGAQQLADCAKIEAAALPLIAEAKNRREIQCQELEPLCAELEAEAQEVAEQLGDAQGCLDAVRETGLLGMQQQLGELTEKLKLVKTERITKSRALLERQMSVLERLVRPDEAAAVLDRQEAVTEKLKQSDLVELEAGTLQLERELQDRTVQVGALMKQIREDWNSVGYSRAEGDPTDQAIATHDMGVIGLEDGAVELLRRKLAEVVEIRAARELEVHGLHERLKATWNAVEKLINIEAEQPVSPASGSSQVSSLFSQLQLEEGAEGFISEHGSLRIADSQACEQKLHELRLVLVEREKPVRKALKDLYSETHSTMDDLEMFFLKIDECDCAVKRSQHLQSQIEEMKTYKESIAALLKLICERDALLRKASEFEEAAENREGRFKGSSLHLLEEEKFRKQFTKRYPRLGEMLRHQICAWEQDQGKVFVYDGLGYKDVLEAEDLSRLGLDLKKVGKAKVVRTKDTTASSLMRANQVSTPTKSTATKSAKNIGTPRGGSALSKSKLASPRGLVPAASPRVAPKRVRTVREAADPPDLSKTAPVGCRALSPVSYTHLRAHETPEHLVCRLLLEKKKKNYMIKDI